MIIKERNFILIVYLMWACFVIGWEYELVGVEFTIYFGWNRSG